MQQAAELYLRCESDATLALRDAVRDAQCRVVRHAARGLADAPREAVTAVLDIEVLDNGPRVGQGASKGFLKSLLERCVNLKCRRETACCPGSEPLTSTPAWPHSFEHVTSLTERVSARGDGGTKCAYRAEVLLRFRCELDGRAVSAWLTPDQVIERGGADALLEYVRALRASGAFPTRGSVSTLYGGPPCQELSAANRYGVKTGVLDADQAPLPTLCLFDAGYRRPQLATFCNTKNHSDCCSGLSGMFAFSATLAAAHTPRLTSNTQEQRDATGSW